jgi:hypothetical protein
LRPPPGRPKKKPRVEYRILSGNACLLNHACHRHATVCSGVLTRSGTKVVRVSIWHRFETVRRVKAGDELTLCYGEDHESHLGCRQCLTACKPKAGP